MCGGFLSLLCNVSHADFVEAQSLYFSGSGHLPFPFASETLSFRLSSYCLIFKCCFVQIILTCWFPCKLVHLNLLDCFLMNAYICILSYTTYSWTSFGGFCCMECAYIWIYVVVVYHFSLIFDLVSGVGKTSLVHLILKGSSISRPSQTVGCTVGVKVILFLFLKTCICFSSKLAHNVLMISCPACFLWKC